MPKLFIILALALLVSCEKPVTDVASWSFQTWGTSVHERGLAHFTEDDSLYLRYQGNSRQISVRVDREKRKGHDRITLSSKDSTFGTIHFIETLDKNKEISWQLGDHLYREMLFTRQ